MNFKKLISRLQYNIIEDYKGKIYNNTDSKTNGELDFYNFFSPFFDVVFDVGCRYDTLMLDCHCEVHYFDPNPQFISKLKAQKSNNKKSFYNAFGLGSKQKQIEYYPKYQSFHDRTVSCGKSDKENMIMLDVTTASSYIDEKDLNHITFLKIDTEGHELEVLNGFAEKLHMVDIVQFEYGGTYKDSNIKFSDVFDKLRQNGFEYFYYLVENGMVPVKEVVDHYNYCNVVCFRI